MPPHALGRHIDLFSPRGYYLDYSGYARTEGECDATGLPVVRVRGGARTPSPALAARSALGNLELYLENGATERRDRFLLIARRLRETIEYIPGSFAGWSMPDAPRGLRGRLPEGWFSAAAHAECIAVLVRAASLMREDGAVEAARRALGGFYTSVEDGGFLREIGESGDDIGVESLAFIEEYPLAAQPRMMLASHVRAVWAVHDYLGVEEDPGARVLLKRCLDGLSFVLDRFDLGYWTRSSLDGRRPRPASAERHGTHVLMMDLLARMSGSDGFAEAGARWRSYGGSPLKRGRAALGRTLAAVWNVGTTVTPE